jgi:hypothetical protein
MAKTTFFGTMFYFHHNDTDIIMTLGQAEEIITEQKCRETI